MDLSARAISAFTLLLLVIRLGAEEPVRFEVPFQIEKDDGVIFVKGSINGGSPQLFILDTGATETIITPPAAEALGIHGQSAWGGDPVTKVNSISVGGATVSDVTVFVFDPPQALSLRLNRGINYNGILGCSFLSQFVITIDYQKKILIFIPHQNKQSSGENKTDTSTDEIPFEVVNNHIHVKGWVNKKGPLTLLFDTGATATLLTQYTARRFGIGGTPLISPPGAFFTDLDSLSVGRTVIKKMPIIIYDPPQASGIEYNGILGYTFMSRFLVTIDYRRKILTLAPYENRNETAH